MPKADKIIIINKTMNKTLTICATGAGKGSMPTNHQIKPNTTKYTIKLTIISFSLSSES